MRITLLACFCITAGPTAVAQSWPARPIHIVVPYAPGGAVDIVARVAGQGLSERLKQPVLIDNKPGAGANIGMDAVAKSAPDGYTLLMAANALATNGSLFAKLTFDPQKDFAPVGLIGNAPLVVVVPANSPFHTFNELITSAKADPGKLTFGSAGNGSSGHLAGEALRQSAHIDVMHIPYKGGAPALTDLLGERISFMPINAVEAITHINDHKLRALAVAGPNHLALLPNTPTAAEAGLSDFNVSVWWGLMAPAGTPASVVDHLNAELQKVLLEPAIRTRLAELGVVISGGTPAQFGDFIHTETTRWGRLVKAANIKPD
jgi:tripartite-type tricarboxylate transporter receptor subunit TctC